MTGFTAFLGRPDRAQEIEAWCPRCIIICFIVLIIWHSVRALPQVTPHTQSVLLDLKCYCLTWTCRPNMPGRSSAAKEEPIKAGSPLSLLGAAGGTLGGTSKDDHIVNPLEGSPVTSPANTTLAELVCQWEKYSLLVCIFTTRDRRSLEPHAWVEDLLKDLFQSILGVNLSVILLSPTECLIFCGNRTQGQGMSWDESLRYTHQLSGIHPWTGYMIEVVALQRTLKEAHHEMQVAREFTHERTKQRIAHLNALAVALTVKAQPAMPQRFPRGCSKTRWVDQFFLEQQLRELNLDEPAFAHHPALLGARLGTPEYKQFDSSCEDAEEDEGDATSMLDAELHASTGEEMDATGHPAFMPSADRCQQRNRALRRECNQAWREFCRLKNRWLSFPLFRETTKEDAISYRDWHSEIEDALEQGHDSAKVKEAMFASLEGMPRWSMRMGTCMWHAFWMGWTPCMGCPWCSSRLMLPCAVYSRGRWNLPVPTITAWHR